MKNYSLKIPIGFHVGNKSTEYTPLSVSDLELSIIFDHQSGSDEDKLKALNDYFSTKSFKDNISFCKNHDFSQIKLSLNGRPPQKSSPLVDPKKLVDLSDLTKRSSRYSHVNTNTAIICCYYNPTNNKAMLSNWNYFNNYISACKMPLFSIELSYDGSFHLPNDKNIKRVKSNSIMWQKEVLLNMLARELPSKYKNIAWIDIDIYFDNPSWPDMLLSIMENYNFVQMYSFYRWYTRDSREIEYECHSAIKVRGGHSSYGENWPASQPGGAICSDRSFFEKVGLFEYAICGGGDEMVIGPVLGQAQCKNYSDKINQITAGNQSLLNKWADWQESLSINFNPNVSFLDQTAHHKWHGSLKNRQYQSRSSNLKNIDFSKNLAKNNFGCFEFINVGAETIKGFKDYFLNRKEDE